MPARAKRLDFVDFGEFAMQALERGCITNHQIEACRVAINREFNRRGKVWIRIFPDKSVSKKPAETRMGKGKGAPDHWVAVISRAALCLKWAVCPKKWRRAHCARRQRSCL